MWKVYFISVVIIIFVASCGDSGKNSESVSETAIESSELEGYSEKFQKLMLTEEGVLRGFTFITDSSEVKRNENADFLSSSSEQLAYTIEFNELEMADIIYHLKGNEIDTFEIDLYLKNKEATDSVAADFTRFYNKKYGEPFSKNDSLLVWQDASQQVGVQLKYIDQNIDHGLNIFLYPFTQEQKVQ